MSGHDWGGWTGGRTGSAGGVVRAASSGGIASTPGFTAQGRRRVWDCVNDLTLDGTPYLRSALLSPDLQSTVAVFVNSGSGQPRLDGWMLLFAMDGTEFDAVSPTYPAPAINVLSGSISWSAGLVMSETCDLVIPGLGGRERSNSQFEAAVNIINSGAAGGAAWFVGTRSEAAPNTRHGCGMWRSGGGAGWNYGRGQWQDGAAPSIGSPGAPCSNAPLTNESFVCGVTSAIENADNVTGDAALWLSNFSDAPGKMSGGALKDELNAADQPLASADPWLYKQGALYSMRVTAIRWRGFDGQ